MPKLARKLSLLAVIAGALCSVIGGGINVLVVNIQSEVPGIGNLVPLSILIGGVIAFFIALTYSILSSAMPRAGGGYVYVSRGLSPFWGFVLAFVKWIGTVISIGAVSFMDVLILADSFHFLGLTSAEQFLRSPLGEISIPISLIWFFWLIHMLGVRKYGITVIALMFLMFFGGAIIIGTNFLHTTQDFISTTHIQIPSMKQGSWVEVIYASAILFWAYIGFTGISQAGGEIKNPKKNLPLAFLIASVVITGYYFIYSLALYHAIPWQYVASKENLTVPGLTGIFLPKSLAFLISILVFLMLVNDIPPALLTSSRLFFSWAQDDIVPKKLSETNRFKAPHFSLTIVAVISSLIVVEAALEGFFLVVNVVTISRFVVYILMALTLFTIEKNNKKIYEEISFLKNRKLHFFIATVALVFVSFFLSVLIYRDLSTRVSWYKHITVQLIVFVALASLIYVSFVYRMKKKGIDYKRILKELPEE